MTALERIGEAIGNQMAEDENDNVSLALAALNAMRDIELPGLLSLGMDEVVHAIISGSYE